MAVIAFEYKDFEREGFSKDQADKLIAAVGIEVEESDGAQIKINVTPNRPDLLDFVGVLRAIRNFSEKKVPQEGFYKVKDESMLTITVERPVMKIRPYISGMVVKNLDLSGNKLKNLINFTEKFADTYGRKRKKLAIGIHNLDAIKGGLDYTADAAGSITPLNGPGKKMGFDQVMKEHEKGTAYQAAIPEYGTKKALYPHLKDDDKVIALIPITNCEETRVTEKTTELFVDITGTSLATVRNAAALLACSFIDAGADVYPITIDYPKGAETTPVLEYGTRKLSVRKADLTLGVALGRHNIVQLANKMGYVAAKLGNSVALYIPPYRVDVIDERDLIEDLAISFGYDNIVPLPVSGFADGLAQDTMEQENRLATFMVGLGFMESVNSSLTSEKVNFGNLRRAGTKDTYVSIVDAKTTNITMLRTDLLPSLLQNLQDSTGERMPHRLFEVGRVFAVYGDRLVEAVHLGFVSCHARANFAEAKAAAEEIMAFSGIDSVKFTQHSNNAFIEGRCAAVSAGLEVLGVMGEIHPEVLGNFGLEEPAVGAELIVIKEIKYEV